LEAFYEVLTNLYNGVLVVLFYPMLNDLNLNFQN